jgi:hypothetical protein
MEKYRARGVSEAIRSATSRFRRVTQRPVATPRRTVGPTLRPSDSKNAADDSAIFGHVRSRNVVLVMYRSRSNVSYTTNGLAFQSADPERTRWMTPQDGSQLDVGETRMEKEPLASKLQLQLAASIVDTLIERNAGRAAADEF